MIADVVIAVRGGAGAKSRCAARFDGAALARAMLHDMVEAVSGCQNVAQIHVVTPTPAVAAGLPVHIIAEPDHAGVNAAFARACAALPADRIVALLPADLPLIRSQDIAALLAAHQPGTVTVVPSATDNGTGAIVLTAGNPINFAFGTGSFGRHMAEPGARRHDCAAIGEDFDRPEHAARALTQGGRHTRACLARQMQDVA